MTYHIRGVPGTGRGWIRVVTWASWWILFGGSAVQAASPRAADLRPEIHFETSGCTPEVQDSVPRLLVIELAARLSDAVGPDVTEVSLLCAGGLATIGLNDPITAKSSSRKVDLPRGAKPHVHARLLALSTAEMIRWSWAELELLRVAPQTGPPSPASEEAQAAVRAAVGQSNRGDEGSLVVWALYDLRGFTSGAGIVPGGGLGIAYTASSGLGARLDLSANGGSRQISAGTVGVLLVGAGALATWTTAEHRQGGLRATIGAGGRLGLVHLNGESSPTGPLVGHALSDLWGGPVILAGATWTASRWLKLGISGEAGWAVQALRGTVDGGTPFQIGGLWLGLQLGIGVGR